MSNLYTTITPHEIGIRGKKFSNFRPGQLQAAMDIIATDKRFSVLVAPPGSGKSMIYVAVMRLLEARACVLTVTTALQEQLKGDFPDCETVMGMGRYECLKDGDYCDTGSCNIGESCDHKYRDCLFYSQMERARYANMVVNNYAFWHYGPNLGKFDFLVLDEAHKAVDVVTSILSTRVRYEDVRTLGLWSVMPSLDDGNLVWSKFLYLMLMKIKASDRPVLWKDKGNEIERTLRFFEFDIDNWIVTDDLPEYPSSDKNKEGGFSVTPIWPGRYFSKCLYRNISKVLLVSATLDKESLGYMGLEEKDYHFIELPSLFPKKQRPFIYITKQPKTKIDFRTSGGDFVNFVTSHVDEVIRSRPGLKGIVQSRSFRWAEHIVNVSRYSSMMISNDRHNTSTVVKQFKKSTDALVLVSPSVESGYDFPYDECRYQIILKVPFVDTRGRLMTQRCKDSRYSNMLVRAAIMQMYGRSTRAPDDWSQVFIFDLHWLEFWRRQRLFFARFFRQAYRTMGEVPKPITCGFPRSI